MHGSVGKRGLIKDPIRSRVDCRVATDVETVIVGGMVVIENRPISGAPPIEPLLTRARAFAEAYAAYAQLNWQGCTADEAFLNAFPWAE